jgi:YVTN family beta-propeller protein
MCRSISWSIVIGLNHLTQKLSESTASIQAVIMRSRVVDIVSSDSRTLEFRLRESAPRWVILHHASRIGLFGVLTCALTHGLAAAQPRAYVPTRVFSDPGCSSPFGFVTGGNVDVINTATEVVIASVPVGTDPYGAAVNPAGTRVYVTNRMSDTVSVIDTSTNNVAATISLAPFDQPQGLAVNPAGTRVYVANSQSYTLAVIDTTTNTVLQWVPVVAQTLNVVVSPDGATVYVGGIGGISVVDAGTNSVIATLPVSATGLAINAPGTRLYAAHHAQPYEVAVIDTATNATITTIPTIAAGLWGLALHPNGTRLYVAHEGSGFVSVIDTASNSVLATIPLAAGAAYGIAADPQGTKVYAANRFSASVSVINASTNTVTGTVAVGCEPIAFGQFIGGISGFVFTGFFAPIDNNGVLNQANAGQTIPIRWRLTTAAGVPIDDPASFVSVTSRLSDCGAPNGSSVIEEYAGASGLLYHGDGNWEFNWKTPKAYAGQCRLMYLNLVDQTAITSTRTAIFQFK